MEKSTFYWSTKSAFNTLYCHDTFFQHLHWESEIGRASCRESLYISVVNVYIINEVPITQEQNNHPFVDIQKVSFNTIFSDNPPSHRLSITLVLKVVPQYYK